MAISLGGSASTENALPGVGTKSKPGSIRDKSRLTNAEAAGPFERRESNEGAPTS